MAGWTNKAKAAYLEGLLENAGRPAAFAMALFTSATAPTADTNLITDLTEITAGNGYTAGGSALTLGTSFDTLTEDDTNDRGTIQVVDVVWTASGGPIPASGGGARYACVLDDNVTEEVWHYFDLGADQSVSNGQTLTLQDAEIRITE